MRILPHCGPQQGGLGKMVLARRDWVPAQSEDLVQSIAEQAQAAPSAALMAQLAGLAEANREIHERACFNLNPATNVMNPKAEALLASGIGSRPSLGYPGDKYEMGLEAIEEIEVIAAALCAQVFQAYHHHHLIYPLILMELQQEQILQGNTLQVLQSEVHHQ